MQDSSKKALVNFLASQSFKTVLDVPSGSGWLKKMLPPNNIMDGIDLFEEKPLGYRNFWKYDLDDGLPEINESYDLICCCEGIEHVGNPLLLLRSFYKLLNVGGQLIITTPNIWYPQSRLQFLLRGFFPSFPSLVDKQIHFGHHMHITPWSYPQLYLYLKLAGFGMPDLINEPLSKPKHSFERLVGLPSMFYCKGKLKKSKTEEEREFWRIAGTSGSRLGHHLIVLAEKVKT